MKLKAKLYLLVMDSPTMGESPDYRFCAEKELKNCKLFHEFVEVYEIKKQLTAKQKEKLGMTSIKEGRK